MYVGLNVDMEVRRLIKKYREVSEGFIFITFKYKVLNLNEDLCTPEQLL